MKGSIFRSAIFAVAAAASLALATSSVVFVVDSGAYVLRRTVGMMYDLGRWLVQRLPKVQADWLGAWRRALAVREEVKPMSLQAYRRPVVSPRWRMCPST